MIDLLTRAERRATKAVAVFERAKQDLRTANEHLETVKAQAAARIDKVVARADAEIARLTAARDAHVTHQSNRAGAASEAQAKNASVLAKIESLLS